MPIMSYVPLLQFTQLIMAYVSYITPSLLWKYSDSGVEVRRTQKENPISDVVSPGISANPWHKLIWISVPENTSFKNALIFLLKYTKYW